MTLIRVDNQTGTITGLAAAATTSFQLSSPWNGPTVVGPNYVRMILDPPLLGVQNTLYEVVYATVTNASSTVNIVQRGAEGSPTWTHAPGATWMCGTTSNDFAPIPTPGTTGGVNLLSSAYLAIGTWNPVAGTGDMQSAISQAMNDAITQGSRQVVLPSTYNGVPAKYNFLNQIVIPAGIELVSTMYAGESYGPNLDSPLSYLNFSGSNSVTDAIIMNGVDYPRLTGIAVNSGVSGLRSVVRVTGTRNSVLANTFVQSSVAGTTALLYDGQTQNSEHNYGENIFVSGDPGFQTGLAGEAQHCNDSIWTNLLAEGVWNPVSTTFQVQANSSALRALQTGANLQFVNFYSRGDTRTNSGAYQIWTTAGTIRLQSGEQFSSASGGGLWKLDGGNIHFRDGSMCGAINQSAGRLNLRNVLATNATPGTAHTMSGGTFEWDSACAMTAWSLTGTGGTLYPPLYSPFSTGGATYGFTAFSSSGQTIVNVPGAQLNVANTFTQPQTLPVIDKGGQVFNVAAYGSLTPDAAAAIIAAHAAAVSAGGGVVQYPAGTIPVLTLATLTGNGVTHRGVGRTVTVLQQPITSSAGPMIAVAGDDVAFEDIGFDWQCGIAGDSRSTSTTMITNVGVQRPRYTRCWIYRGPGNGLKLNHSHDWRIEDCLFQEAPTATHSVTMLAFQASGDSKRGTVKGNRFHYVSEAVELTGGVGYGVSPIENVSVVDNRMDLGWYTMPAQFSGSGGTVTYSDANSDGFTDTITDTGASFAGLSTAGKQFIRVMPVLATNSGGTVTYDAMSITDTSAPFPPTILEGHIVKTATAGLTRWALVSGVDFAGSGTATATSATTLTDTTRPSAVENPLYWPTNGLVGCQIVAGGSTAIITSNTQTVLTASGGWTGGTPGGTSAYTVQGKVLRVEEWLSDLDRTFQTPPTNGDAFTVYNVLLGSLTASTGTTLTCLFASFSNGFIDRNGSAQAAGTPAAGTRYEVGRIPGGYPIYPSGYVRDCLFDGNTFKRAFGDNIEYSLYSERIGSTNNVCYDGYDTGIFIQGIRGHRVINNTLRHMGSIGVGCYANGSIIAQNTCLDSQWTHASSAAFDGDIQVNCNNTQVLGNHCEALTSTHAYHGISQVTANTGNIFDDNVSLNHLADDYVINGTATGTIYGANVGVGWPSTTSVQSSTAAAVATSGTIATANVGIARVSPAGAVTAVVLAPGTAVGQSLVVRNEAANANSVTFDVAGTSNVADGASVAIAGLTQRAFTWSGTLWYGDV